MTPVVHAAVWTAALTTVLACGDNTRPAGFDAGSDALSDDLSMPLTPTLSVDNFNSAETCGQCHTRHYAEWKTSMHSYAMIDPIYRALVKVRQQDFDGAQDKFCLQCHTAIGTRGGEIQPGFDFEDLSPVVLEGVTCESCHKVSAIERPFNSGHVIDEDGPIRGPIQDPIASGFHESEYSPIFEQPDFCAGCHDVVEVSGLNLERPFAEYLESPGFLSGQTCNDCHMPTYEGRATADAPMRTLHEHRWVGVDLPLTDDFLTSDEYDDLRTRIRGLLAGSVELELQASSEVTAGQQLDLVVNMTNTISSHAFPTGSTFNRQAWLEVIVTDGAGATIYQTGDLDANGDLRNYYSELDRFGDQDLIMLGSSFVNDQGTPELFSWRATEHHTTSISPGFERTYTLFIPTTAATTGPLQIDARLRFRSFPPFLLRLLDLGQYASRLEIYDVDTASLSVTVNP